MFDGDETERLRKFASTLSLFGKTTAIAKVQEMMIPHILEIFAEYDHTELERMIAVDYPLVREQCPVGIKNALRNLGENDELRRQWEGLILNNVTPAHIIEWLRNPEEWLDAEDADQQREELRKCADVLENTEGGEEWLQRQVIQLYRYANIVPESSTRKPAND